MEKSRREPQYVSGQLKSVDSFLGSILSQHHRDPFLVLSFATIIEKKAPKKEVRENSN